MKTETHFTDATFETEVLGSPLPVLVDFWAPWCGPCRALAPAIEELAGEYAGRAVVGKINAEGNPETVAKLRVSGIPALLGV